MRVSRAELQDVVYDYLKSFEELSAVKTKDVRLYVQKKLDLPEDYFSGDKKEELVDIISCFSSRLNNSSATHEQAEYKEGRFSKEESNIVVQAAKRYAEEKGIRPEDLCTSTKVKGEDNCRHSEFWREAQALLPHRKRESIWHHAQRVLARPVAGDGKFTELEKGQLQQLVKVHGRDFNLIGGLMGRLPDDCQQNLQRMTARKITGKFSPDEDDRMTEALRTLLKMPGAHPADIPQRRLPWSSVASMLQNERLPVDYARRWPIVVRNATIQRFRLRGEAESEEALNAALIQSIPKDDSLRLSRDNASSTSRRLQLIELLIDRGYSDESEVNWAQIDRELNYIVNSSIHRWKSMLQMLPRGDPDVQEFPDKLEWLQRKLGASSAGDQDSDSNKVVRGIPIGKEPNRARNVRSTVALKHKTLPSATASNKTSPTIRTSLKMTGINKGSSSSDSSENSLREDALSVQEENSRSQRSLSSQSFSSNSSSGSSSSSSSAGSRSRIPCSSKATTDISFEDLSRSPNTTNVKVPIQETNTKMGEEDEDWSVMFKNPDKRNGTTKSSAASSDKNQKYSKNTKVKVEKKPVIITVESNSDSDSSSDHRPISSENKRSSSREEIDLRSYSSDNSSTSSDSKARAEADLDQIFAPTPSKFTATDGLAGKKLGLSHSMKPTLPIKKTVIKADVVDSDLSDEDDSHNEQNIPDSVSSKSSHSSRSHSSNRSKGSGRSCNSSDSDIDPAKKVSSAVKAEKTICENKKPMKLNDSTVKIKQFVTGQKTKESSSPVVAATTSSTLTTGNARAGAGRRAPLSIEKMYADDSSHTSSSSSLNSVAPILAASTEKQTIAKVGTTNRTANTIEVKTIPSDSFTTGGSARIESTTSSKSVAQSHALQSSRVLSANATPPILSSTADDLAPSEDVPAIPSATKKNKKTKRKKSRKRAMSSDSDSSVSNAAIKNKDTAPDGTLARKKKKRGKKNRSSASLSSVQVTSSSHPLSPRTPFSDVTSVEAEVATSASITKKKKKNKKRKSSGLGSGSTLQFTQEHLKNPALNGIMSKSVADQALSPVQSSKKRKL